MSEDGNKHEGRKNCYDHVTSTLKIPQMFQPDDETLSKKMTKVSTSEEADVVGVQTTYRDGGSNLTHMGLVEKKKGKMVIDHVPNMGYKREPEVPLKDFEEEYEQDGDKIVFFKLKKKSGS